MKRIYPQQVAQDASRAIIETMTTAQASHGDAWRTRSPYEDIAHVIEHLRLFSVGDTTEPHIKHAITRLAFIVSRGD